MPFLGKKIRDTEFRNLEIGAKCDCDLGAALGQVRAGPRPKPHDSKLGASALKWPARESPIMK
jgi:hypothetical protein